MTRLHPTTGFLLLLLLAPARAGSAQPGPAPLPEGVRHAATVEGITEYRLENGLRVVLLPDESKQTISVNVVYLVGSRHEGPGEAGAAHLLEHLLFRGTPRHPSLKKELSERTAVQNGRTTRDSTWLYETFQAGDTNLEWALDIESERMVNAAFTQADLKDEVRVIGSEIVEHESNPLNVLTDRVCATAYQWHTYGRPTLGTHSGLANVTLDQLRRFYRTFYRPDNAVLLVAGKIDEAKTLALVQAKFGGIPRPERALPAPPPAEPAQDGERSVGLRRSAVLEQGCVAYHIPAGSHPDAAALELAMEILGDPTSGRLYRALVGAKLAASLSCGCWQHHDPGLAVFTVTGRRGVSLDAAWSRMLQVLDAMAASPPAKAEVERARARRLRRFESVLDDSEATCFALGIYAALGDWRLLFLHRDRLRKVTPQDVQRVARTYLTNHNCTSGLLPACDQVQRAEIPPRPDIEAMLRNYRGDPAAAAGEAWDASPASIEAHTRFLSAGTLKLALLPRKTRGAVVHAELCLHFGNEKALLGQGAAATLAGGMLMRGTVGRTRQQIQDTLDRLRAKVTVDGGAQGAYASIQTTRANLPAVLRLVAEALRRPTFHPAEFELLKHERLSDLAGSGGDAYRLTWPALCQHIAPYPKGDPRRALTMAEQEAALRATRLEDVKRFHARFYGAPAGELAVVGDFDPDAVAALAPKLFAGWKSRQAYSRLPTRYYAVHPRQISIENPDRPAACVVAGLPLPLCEEDPDYPALVLGTHALGGFAGSRLAARIRGKEGLSYSVGASLVASALDRGGILSLYAMPPSKDAARVEKLLREELERAVRDGFTQEELSAARAGLLQAYQVGRSQDPNLASELAWCCFIGRKPSWTTAHEKRLQELTPDEVRGAFARHIDPAKLSVARAGDFAGAR